MTEFNLKSGNATPFKMMGSSSPLNACVPGDPDCDKRFRIGKQRGRRIKKWFSTASKNISKTTRKVIKKVKEIEVPTIINRDKSTSYKTPRYL